MSSLNSLPQLTAELSALAQIYPLHAAVYRKKADVVRTFISVQQDPEPLNQLLNLAVEGISTHTRRSLQEYQNTTPLEIAILQGNHRVFGILLEHNLIDIETPSTCFPAKTPLQVSIIKHDSYSFGFQIVLKSKSKNASNLPLHVAYLNYRDQDGNTAAHYAAEKGFDNLLNLLALNGADLNVRNTLGLTPVQTALLSQKTQTAIHLLSLQGVRLNTDTTDDDRSFSLILEAMREDDEDLLKAILNNNPQITHCLHLDEETDEETLQTLMDAAVIADAKNCFVYLRGRGFQVGVNNLQYIMQHPEDVPELFAYLTAILNPIQNPN